MWNFVFGFIVFLIITAILFSAYQSDVNQAANGQEILHEKILHEIAAMYYMKDVGTNICYAVMPSRHPDRRTFITAVDCLGGVTDIAVEFNSQSEVFK